MTTDPLRELVEGHERVSEWLSTMWNAMGLMSSNGPADLAQLQIFFSTHVMEHFALEETVVFPALLERDSSNAVSILVEELRKDHVAILGATSRLMADLAWCMAHDEPAEHIRALQGRTRDLIEAILAHAAREDAHLLPIVAMHRQAVAERMTAA